MASGHGEPYKFQTIDELINAYDAAKKGREQLREAMGKICDELYAKGTETSLSWIRHLAKNALEEDAEG